MSNDDISFSRALCLYLDARDHLKMARDLPRDGLGREYVVKDALKALEKSQKLLDQVFIMKRST